MARTPDPAHRAALLDACLAYVTKHGVAHVSLRPLAAAVDSSPRVLLYYFGSKEQLVTEILGRARERQRVLFARLSAKNMRGTDGCRAIWSIMSAPSAEPTFRLFFEVCGLALQDRKRFGRFLRSFVAPWLEFIGDPLVHGGWTRADADSYATLVIAGFRGFMLDLCATRDRARVDRAVELFLEALCAAGAEQRRAS